MIINRNFTLLLTGQLVSQVGDKFHTIALSLWVLSTFGSTAKMGAVLAASLIPSLILGLFSGSIIDRYHRKVLIVGTDVIRGLVLACFALLCYSGQMSFSLILLLQVILSVNAAFFDPAIPSVIPQIVPEPSLNRANALHQFVAGFALIGGAVLGGIFMGAFGFFWVLVLNAASFLMSALFESFIAIPVIRSESRESLMAAIRDGYRYVFRNRLLGIVLFMVFLIHFFVGSIEVFMPVIADRISPERLTLERISGSGAETLGFFQAAFGGGSILAGFLLSLLPWNGTEKQTLFSAVFVMGGIYGVLSFLPVSPTGFSGALFLFGLAIMTAGISFKTLLQRHTDVRYSGRVFALAGSLGNAAIPGAMIVYGLLLEQIDFRGLLLVSGLVLMGLSLISFVLCREETDDRNVAQTP